MIIDEPITPTDQWVDAWTTAKDAGFNTLDFLAGVDRGDVIEVIGHCFGPAGSRFLRTTANPGIPSIVDVFPAADWFEREIVEMFGVDIGSGQPLLLHDSGPAPLRKSVPLPARTQTPWPGAKGAPPGVLETWEQSS
jgi:NADH:ubiquinone oxidoreductase subunit C